MKVVHLLVLALAGCRMLEPDYVEASPYIQYGDHSFDRPVSSFDEETWGLMFTVGWHVGVMHQAMNNLSLLDVSRSGELTMRDDPALSVNIQNEQAQESSTESEAETSVVDDVLKPAKDEGEARAFLLWALGLVVLAASAWLLSKAGLHLPFFPRNKKENDAD